METTTSSGILKTIYHNSSYLLLFGKRKLQSFEILLEEIPHTLKQAPPSNKCRTLSFEIN